MYNNRLSFSMGFSANVHKYMYIFIGNLCILLISYSFINFIIYLFFLDCKISLDVNGKYHFVTNTEHKLKKQSPSVK